MKGMDSSAIKRERKYQLTFYTTSAENLKKLRRNVYLGKLWKVENSPQYGRFCLPKALKCSFQSSN